MLALTSLLDKYLPVLYESAPANLVISFIFQNCYKKVIVKALDVIIILFLPITYTLVYVYCDIKIPPRL